MQEVDNLEHMLASFNFSGMVPAPWGRLSHVQNRTRDLRDQVTIFLPAEVDSSRSADIAEKVATVKKRKIEADTALGEIKYFSGKFIMETD